jgi:hypothetical protein
MADNLQPIPRSAGSPGENVSANSAASQAPAKADAAPKPGATETGTGLIAALNAYWGGIAKSKGLIPDIYEIKFADPFLSNASVVPPGPLDKSFAGGSLQVTAADKLASEKQNMSPAVRQRSATAGQQILQFIDTVLRNSNYITDQQKVIWNSKTNAWEYNGKPAQNFAWFNISCQAEQLQYDPKQNDFAYRITYIIAPYQIPVQSEYFDNNSFRGVHKVYNYWFTGQNSQVTHFEQNYNNAWTQSLTSDASVRAGNESNASRVNSREQWKKRYMPASNQARQGSDGNTFEPGANAADYLYSVDTATIALNILGDPAWIPPPTNIQPGQFSTSPFFADGSINTTASAAYFEFAWNKPTDYNTTTGLMDPGQNNFGSSYSNYVVKRANDKAGVAQQAISYLATGVKSKFRGGKFTQELTGTWLQTPAKNAVAAADTGRKTDPVTGTTPVGSINNAQDPERGGTSVDSLVLQAGASVYNTNNVQNLATSVVNIGSSSTPNLIASINNATLRPAEPPTQDPALNPNPAVAAPPVLPKNGLGSRAYDLEFSNSGNTVVSSTPLQGIVNDDQGKPR